MTSLLMFNYGIKDRFPERLPQPPVMQFTFFFSLLPFLYLPAYPRLAEKIFVSRGLPGASLTTTQS
jgi:hypothetical protein